MKRPELVADYGPRLHRVGAPATRRVAQVSRWQSRAHDVIVSTMAKHRELARELYATSLGRKSASTIWRTVVFAGAMLAAPLTGCGGSKTPPPAAPDQAATAPAPDQAAKDREAADAAQREAADKAAADQAAAAAEAEKTAADQKAKEDADAKVQADADAKRAEEEAAAAKKKRPRGGGDSRPKGRGFVLA
jgi:type IV secretory pathway VirB10-like protein